MRTDVQDAATLRDAAWVLQTRADKQTVLLRLLCETLRKRANRIERGAA